MARWKKIAFETGLQVIAKIARSPVHGLVRPLTRALGVFTLKVQGGQPQQGLAATGDEWQRMFPSPERVPITGRDERTVYAEIHERCPLRGTGDVHACHRMMEYDRRMLERIGGQLVVLRSQSEPGRTHCEVAIRLAGAPTDDLIPAHLRVGAGSA